MLAFPLHDSAAASNQISTQSLIHLVAQTSRQAVSNLSSKRDERFGGDYWGC